MTPTFASFSGRLAELIRHASGPPQDRGAARDDTQFNALALDLFALQFEHNTAYRHLCTARHRHPANVDHWTQIPPAPTVAFKELELTSLQPAERTTVFHSSGTVGQTPSRHFHNPDSLAIYETSLLPWFQRHLLPETSSTNGPASREFQFISLTPPEASVPHSSLVHMFASLHRACGSEDSFFAGAVTSEGFWGLDARKLISALRDATRPVLLLGTAFTFVGLLDELAALSVRVQLPGGSRVLETGGYKGRSRSLPKHELHALIGERLGIASNSIVSEYGMSELSSQAYDSVAGVAPDAPSHHESRCFQFPPWARVQLISPETGDEVIDGEAGLIRVFDLANVRSALAVQTEDLGVRRGNRFQLLGRAPRAEARGCSLVAL